MKAIEPFWPQPSLRGCAVAVRRLAPRTPLRRQRRRTTTRRCRRTPGWGSPDWTGAWDPHERNMFDPAAFDRAGEQGQGRPGSSRVPALQRQVGSQVRAPS